MGRAHYDVHLAEGQLFGQRGVLCRCTAKDTSTISAIGDEAKGRGRSGIKRAVPIHALEGGDSIRFRGRCIPQIRNGSFHLEGYGPRDFLHADVCHVHRCLIAGVPIAIDGRFECDGADGARTAACAACACATCAAHSARAAPGAHGAWVDRICATLEEMRRFREGHEQVEDLEIAALEAGCDAIRQTRKRSFVEQSITVTDPLPCITALHVGAIGEDCC